MMAVQAVDQLLLTRETIQAVALRHSRAACFLPKVFRGCSGNGAHCHFSLHQVRQGLGTICLRCRVQGLMLKNTMFVVLSTSCNVWHTLSVPCVAWHPRPWSAQMHPHSTRAPRILVESPWRFLLQALSDLRCPTSPLPIILADCTTSGGPVTKSSVVFSILTHENHSLSCRYGHMGI